MSEKFAGGQAWRVWFDRPREDRRALLLFLYKCGYINWTDIMVCYRSNEISKKEIDWLFCCVDNWHRYERQPGRRPASLPVHAAYWQYRHIKGELCPHCNEVLYEGEVCSSPGHHHFVPRENDDN